MIRSCVRARGGRAPVASALALLLAACAGAVVSGYTDYSPFYAPSVVRHAGAGSAFPLVLHGRPFALPAEDSATAVARAMQLPPWFAPRPCAPAPVADAPAGDYRVVLVFNAAGPLDPRRICGPLEEIAVEPVGALLRVDAAFCTRDELISRSRATVPATGPDSPGFRRLLDQIAFALFPPQNPLHIDDEPEDRRRLL